MAGAKIDNDDPFSSPSPSVDFAPAILSPAAYDPRQHGARCDECPLRGRPVVPPEIRPGRMLVIGEAPGADEESQGRPFVGRSGRELETTLSKIGRTRDDLSISNVLLCRPPGNRLNRLLRQVSKQNKERRKAGEPPLPGPLECCAPRLAREVDEAPSLLILGSTALHAVIGEAGGEKRLFKLRGFPFMRERLGASPQPALVTLHPAYVLRSRQWTETFRADVAKAFRHAAGRLEWEEPEIVWDPTPSQVDGLLSRMSSEIVAVDVETTRASVERNTLLCVGLGTAKFGFTTWFQSIEDPPRKAACSSAFARERIANFLARHSKICGQNVNVFDRRVLERYGMPLPLPYWRVKDSVIAHHVIDGELPHDLNYLSSRYTDAPRHKPGTIDVYRTDEDLGRYNVLDCIISARVVEMLIQQVIEQGLDKAYLVDVDKQRLCLNMHRAGLLVDQAERDCHRQRLKKQMYHAQARMQDLTGLDINIGSHIQLREYLYDSLGILPPEEKPGEVMETDGGEIPVDKDSLYELLARGDLPQIGVEVIETILDYRRAEKSLGTFVEMSKVEFDAQGRIHPQWSPHTVVTGRLSCSAPNCFSGDTEILTEDGFVRFDQLPRDARVAQWMDNRVEFVKPVGHVRVEAASFIELANEHIDLMVTPEHRCLLQHRKTGQLKVFGAENYPEDWKQLHGGSYVDGCGLPLSTDELTVLIAAQADGHFQGGGIDFGFTKKRKFDRLVAALDRAKLGYKRVNSYCGRLRLVVKDAHFVDYARELLGSKKQYSGGIVLRLSQDQLLHFTDEVFQWDGLSTRGTAFFSTDRQSAEWVQVAQTLVGRRATLYRRICRNKDKKHHVWEVSVPRDRRGYSLTTNIEQQQAPGGMAYCVSVPSGFIVVRRNGKTAVTGNCQTIPSTKLDVHSLRSMYVPAPGNVLVVCDAAQIEFRNVALLSRDPAWLHAFRTWEIDPATGLVLKKGIDGHRLNAATFFSGKVTYDTVQPYQRNFAKTLTFMFVYSGGAGRAVRNMRMVRNAETGERPYARFSHKESRALRNALLRDHPALERWWDDSIVEFRATARLRAWMHDRERKFLATRYDDREDESSRADIINFRAQAGAAAIVDEATRIIMDEIGWPWDPECRGKGLGGPGVLAQLHDALLVEVPASRAEEAVAIMLRAFCRVVEWRGESLMFFGEAKTGSRWSEV